MALVKATAEAIGLLQLAESWGLKLEASVFVDSTAALAVTHRKGCGKLRHVRIGHLWVQELAEEGAVSFVKVRGTENPADLMTKHLPATVRDRLVPLVAQYAHQGQASSRLQLRACQTRSQLESGHRTFDPSSDGALGSRGSVRHASR